MRGMGIISPSPFKKETFMKRMTLSLMAAFLLASSYALADHHEVFISSVVDLKPEVCAVELEIAATGQNGFEGVDRIAVNGTTLASLGDSVAGLINGGGHTNTGDHILFASSSFQMET